jgi:hypothetical protein
MFKLALLSAVLLTAAPVAAHAAVDCRIRAMPPASFASKPLPTVKYQGMPLADLQKLYRRMAGLPARAPGLSYCADPLGFVYPWKSSGTQTIYYPTDVTDRCRREVIEHEEAHVKGWGINHPSARLQVGPCKGGKSAWPRTVDAS